MHFFGFVVLAYRIYVSCVGSVGEEVVQNINTDGGIARRWEELIFFRFCIIFLCGTMVVAV